MTNPIDNLAFVKSTISHPTPEPEGFINRTTVDYPVGALGTTLSSLALKINGIAKVPTGLAANCLLMAVTTIAQRKANVYLDGRTSPMCLFSCAIALSGERKTTIDSIAQRPIERHQEEARKVYENEMKAFEIEQKAAEQLEKIAKSKFAKGEINEDEYKVALAKIDYPLRPQRPKLNFGDVTIEGLQKAMITNQPAVAVTSSEGGKFFGGHSMKAENKQKTVSVFSELWDGNAIDVTRAGEDKDIHLANRRVSLNLMIQPVIMRELLQDGLMSEQGFFARFLFSHPKSTMGDRTYVDEDIYNTQEFIDYAHQLDRLLDEGFNLGDDRGCEFQLIRLDKNAKNVWRTFYEEIEIQLRPNGEYRPISGSAGKICEQALRISGVLATFEGRGEINRDLMQRGVTLARYYLNEYISMVMVEEDAIQQESAKLLLDWLKGLGVTLFYGNYKHSSRPSIVRKKTDFEQAMLVLIEKGYIEPLPSQEVDGKIRKEVFRLIA